MVSNRFGWWLSRRKRTLSRLPPNLNEGEVVDILAPVPAHDWRECEPAILEVGERGSDEHLAQMTAVMVLVWSRLRDSDRQAFHRASCLGSRDPRDLAVMRHLSDTMSAEMKRCGF
jgi:hypothetical protein